MENQFTASTPQSARAGAFAVRMHKIRGALSLIVYALLALVIGLPHLGLHLAVSKLRKETEDERHERLSQWFFTWCRAFNWTQWLVLGLRWEFTELPPEDREYLQTRPAFVTANHYGVIDATLLASGANRLDVRKVRGVAKQETRNWPVIGTVFKLGKVAFMRRRNVKEGRNQDVEDLEAFGMSLHQDRSWAVMFVEGTTFEGVPDEGYRNVRKPKTRGAEAMLKHMPDHPMLIVTFVWHDFDERKALGTAAVPPGTRVTIVPHLVRNPDPATVREWLPAEWKKLDDRIDALRKP